jgi:hypothetical protein
MITRAVEVTTETVARRKVIVKGIFPKIKMGFKSTVEKERIQFFQRSLLPTSSLQEEEGI